MKLQLFIFILFFSFSTANSQKVGINQSSPSEPLEVGGIIFTNQGGVKFPDSTIQTTAAFNTSIPDTQILQRSFVVLELDGFMGEYSNSNLGISNGIIILAANFDTERIITCLPGGGGPNFSHINALKNMDALSYQFFQSFAQGQVILNATVYFLELNSNGNLQVHNEWELSNVQLALFNSSASYSSAGFHEHVEEISLAFQAIKVTSYTVGGPVSFSYNVCP